MKISRRKFVVAAPLAAGMLVQMNSVASDQFAIAGSPDAAVAPFSWDSFYPYLTTSFTFRDAADMPVEMRLMQMTDNRTPQTAAEGECFSLIFTGPANQPLKHGVYTIEHFALGTMSLLVTQGVTRKSVIRYEAIINRMTPIQKNTVRR